MEVDKGEREIGRNERPSKGVRLNRFGLTRLSDMQPANKTDKTTKNIRKQTNRVIKDPAV